jgi:hypothetical protein
MPRQRKPNDLSRSLIALDMDTTLIAVVELSLSSWLVAGIVPGTGPQAADRVVATAREGVVPEGVAMRPA